MSRKPNRVSKRLALIPIKISLENYSEDQFLLLQPTRHHRTLRALKGRRINSEGCNPSRLKNSITMHEKFFGNNNE